MNSIYIGDRQLDPDDEFECPWCGLDCGAIYRLMKHISKCPDNPGVDPEPEEDHPCHP